MGSNSSKGLRKNTKEFKTVADRIEKTKKISDKDYDFLIARTHYTKEQIKSFFDKFIQCSPSGKLNKEEFIELYTQVRPEGVERLRNISEFIFRAFDIDHNDSISFAEFIIGYSLTSKGDLKTKLEIAFDLYDADGNGHLDADEIDQVISSMLILLGTQKTTSETKVITQDCIDKLDQNNNGKVSKAEFIEVLLKNYSLRSLLSPFN